jgi:hypothetical protein
MMKTITPHRRGRLVPLAFLVLGLVLLAQTGMAQQGSEDYKVSIRTLNFADWKESAEIVVRVRTLQGEPAHGIPVRFQLDPGWQGDATIEPAQTTTEHGIARARLHADLTGHVGFTVKVGHGTVSRRTGIVFKAFDEDNETGAD